MELWSQSSSNIRVSSWELIRIANAQPHPGLQNPKWVGPALQAIQLPRGKLLSLKSFLEGQTLGVQEVEPRQIWGRSPMSDPQRGG